jgi:hypothetical protein
LFTGNVGCTSDINVFKPSALNLKFPIFSHIFKKSVTYNNELKLERRFRDGRRAPNRSKQGHFTKNFNR